MKCYFCGVAGYLHRNHCPEKNIVDEKSYRCYFCGKVGLVFCSDNKSKCISHTDLVARSRLPIS